MELDVAHRIQADMLPCIFPASLERPEFDIYASMAPAREMGKDKAERNSIASITILC